MELAEGSRTNNIHQSKVLQHVCEGLANKEIAVHMGISEALVKSFLQQLFAKMGARSRAQLQLPSSNTGISSEFQPRPRGIQRAQATLGMHSRISTTAGWPSRLSKSASRFSIFGSPAWVSRSNRPSRSARCHG